MSSNALCFGECPLWLGVCRVHCSLPRCCIQTAGLFCLHRVPIETAVFWCIIAALPGMHLSSWASHPKNLLAHIQSPAKPPQNGGAATVCRVWGWILMMLGEALVVAPGTSQALLAVSVRTLKPQWGRDLIGSGHAVKNGTCVFF